jgi:mRNA-degrading endonuclease RelE of RelBE toxin-antitoxin system
MSYKLSPTSDFARALKQLSKKYPSLKVDIANLGLMLKENPEQGTPIGRSCYKIRLNITSKKKGKRGGARVITYVQIVETTIYLLTIYDKSEKANLSDSELEDLLSSLP